MEPLLEHFLLRERIFFFFFFFFLAAADVQTRALEVQKLFYGAMDCLMNKPHKGQALHKLNQWVFISIAPFTWIEGTKNMDVIW